MSQQLLYHPDSLILTISEVLIGLAYVWISVEISRLIWRSELVSNIKKNPDLLRSSSVTLHQKIITITVAFAITFVFCGLTHWIHTLHTSQGEEFPQLVVLSITLHCICFVTGFVAAFMFSCSIGEILRATNSLEMTPQGRLKSAENVLMDVINNCNESVAVLSVADLTFLRGNASTALFFGDFFLDESIVDIIYELDQHILLDCVVEMLRDCTHAGDKSDRTEEGILERFEQSFDFMNQDENEIGEGDPTKECKNEEMDDEESPLIPLSDSSTSRSGKRKVYCIEYRVYDPHLQLIWLESTLLLHHQPFDESQVDGTIMLLTRDITQKKTEYDMIHRENAAKLQYITCCAHDLKTPLQSFSSALDLLCESSLSKDQLEIWSQAEVSLSLMNLTIAQTMDTSKVLMGYELVPKNDSSCLVDILTTVAMIIDSYGRQVPIYFSIAPNICNEIITDNEWVWQMLLNFLTNACKHTEEGCIHVNVSLCTGNNLPAGRKVDKEDKLKNAPDLTPRPPSPSRTSLDEHLLFQICDTGVGVGILKHDSLFEVFSQAQSGQSAGTGLGLFSVYSRCKRLGGTCGVISPNTVGCEGGSTFWFTIPYIPASKECMEYSDFSRYPTSHALCKSCLMGGTVVMGIDVTWSEKALREEAEREASMSSEGSAGVSGENGKKMRYTAFVVDDVQSIRKLLKRTLIGLGFSRVDVFENGKRALDAMKKEVVDVVFMDIQMPIMSGPEAISRLREFEEKEGRQRQCVVAVSANIEDNSVGMHGFDLQRSKPMREKDILNCMNLVVSQQIPLSLLST